MMWSGRVRIETMVEAICALHLASYVRAPYKDRGGLMLIGPSGVLKTTLLDVLDTHYYNALPISNAFMQTMSKMQPAFYNNQVRSLAFPDVQSIYAGDPRTAHRIEQMMMQLSGEATRTIGGNEDSRYAKFKGYCTIFAAMTPQFYTEHINKWEEMGFARRFLWSTYTFEDPEILMRAIQHWARTELGKLTIPSLPMETIPDALDVEDRAEIRTWVRHQPQPHEIQFQILCKMVSALTWGYKKNGIRRSAMHTLRQFAETLQHDAALLQFPEQKYDVFERIKRNGTPTKNARSRSRR